MIDLNYWPTPNGHKITIFLEEANLAYHLVPVDIGAGEQFSPQFLKLNPNNKIPAIVDRQPADGAAPLALFESGAILLYLAEKTDLFLPGKQRDRFQVLQWLFWQMGGLGPMLGQNHHFSQYAPKKIPYAIDRYRKETDRLYGILDEQLAEKDYIADDYSIADMAIYPWIVPHENQGQDLDDSPNLKRWYQQIAERPAVTRAYAKADEVHAGATLTEESKAILFGQGRRQPQA